ncbi:MAG TPA: glycosyltransferase family 87 protein [Ktedonobacteraceae bacterium]|nr:glycosyltransferase family 87 protein [Ktedonobacteraceae bacterium]
MPVIHVPKALKVPFGAGEEQAEKRPWLRLLVLLLLFLVSLALYGVLIANVPPNDVDTDPFVKVWMVCFLPYFVACGFILMTKPATGRWLWIELGMLFGAALIFRAVLLPLPPGLSRDAWRYLWDARVTLHGYSPYVYPPDAKVFAALQDQIFANMRFRNVPTIYPPGAQAVYLLSYLLAPSNLFVLKGLFIGFDMVTCVSLAFLLIKRGLDPRRVVIYAWCPLPIVEFAIQGHVDVITLPFLLLTVLCALSTRRGARVLTGFLIGIATLTKIYPIFLLVVVVRRRDWALVVTCLLTIVVGYLPYYILSNGQIFGYFSAYASEQGGNGGVIQVVLYNFYALHHARLAAIITVEHMVDVFVVVIASLVVFLLRVRKRISMEAASMVLIGVIFAISSHVFPWYAAALLPWIAVLIVPVHRGRELIGKGIAVATAWYFVCISPISYFYTRYPGWLWQGYYVTVYCGVVAFLAIAAFTGVMHLFAQKRTVTDL